MDRRRLPSRCCGSDGPVARSVVPRDDSLLQGTIAENISGFDEQIDMGRVRECATLAQISIDIDRMPMGYESLVGDMGHRPRIMILDEDTSHLDLPNERAVTVMVMAGSTLITSMIRAASS